MKINKIIIIALCSFLASCAGSSQNKRHGKKPHLDTNKDGKISISEFTNGRDQVKATKRFTTLDTNADGFLSKDEMRKGHRGRKRAQ